MVTHVSQFQKIIETVEALPLDEQAILIEIIQKRLIQQRRVDIVAEVAEARQAYRTGDVRRGNVTDMMGEIID